jgi:hypothetical protein
MRPGAALAANPLVALTALAGLAWSLYAVFATFAPRWRRSLTLDRGAARLVRWLVVALLLANWAYEMAVH